MGERQERAKNEEHQKVPEIKIRQWKMFWWGKNEVDAFRSA